MDRLTGLGARARPGRRGEALARTCLRCSLVTLLLLAPLWPGCSADPTDPTAGQVARTESPSTASGAEREPTAEATPSTSTLTTGPLEGDPPPEPSEPGDTNGRQAPGPARVYTDPEYGFSFAYPEGWKLTVAAGAEGGLGGSSLRDVGAFDPTGSTVRGVLLDGVAVSVFRLNVVVNADLLPAFEAEVEDLVASLHGRLSMVEVVEPLRPTTVNGTPGFETTHTFSYEGRRLRSRVVFLVAGGFEYQLTTQAAESNWDVSGPRLDLLVDTFSPGT